MGKRGFIQAKPRAIIARFLRYTDREAVFSSRSCLEEESGLGIGPDLPKEVLKNVHGSPSYFERCKKDFFLL